MLHIKQNAFTNEGNESCSFTAVVLISSTLWASGLGLELVVTSVVDVVDTEEAYQTENTIGEHCLASG